MEVIEVDAFVELDLEVDEPKINSSLAVFPTQPRSLVDSSSSADEHTSELDESSKSRKRPLSATDSLGDEGRKGVCITSPLSSAATANQRLGRSRSGVLAVPGESNSPLRVQAPVFDRRGTNLDSYHPSCFEEGDLMVLDITPPASPDSHSPSLSPSPEPSTPYASEVSEKPPPSRRLCRLMADTTDATQNIDAITGSVSDENDGAHEDSPRSAPSTPPTCRRSPRRAKRRSIDGGDRPLSPLNQPYQHLAESPKTISEHETFSPATAPAEGMKKRPSRETFIDVNEAVGVKEPEALDVSPGVSGRRLRRSIASPAHESESRASTGTSIPNRVLPQRPAWATSAPHIPNYSLDSTFPSVVTLGSRRRLRRSVAPSPPGEVEERPLNCSSNDFGQTQFAPLIGRRLSRSSAPSTQDDDDEVEVCEQPRRAASPCGDSVGRRGRLRRTVIPPPPEATNIGEDSQEEVGQADQARTLFDDDEHGCVAFEDEEIHEDFHRRKQAISQLAKSVSRRGKKEKGHEDRDTEEEVDVRSSSSGSDSFICDEEDTQSISDRGSSQRSSDDELSFRRSFLEGGRDGVEMAPPMGLEKALNRYLEYLLLCVMSPTLEFPYPDEVMKDQGFLVKKLNADKSRHAEYKAAINFVERRILTKKSQYEGMWVNHGFVTALKFYPILKRQHSGWVSPCELQSLRCAACNRRNISSVLEFDGPAYDSEELWAGRLKNWHSSNKLPWSGKPAFPKADDPLTIEAHSSGSEDSDDSTPGYLTFNIGSHCFDRVSAWHECQHWKFRVLSNLTDWIIEQPKYSQKNLAKLVERLNKDDELQKETADTFNTIIERATLELKGRVET
eukprot:GHVN01066052.1.p1 GENE.GHVN01066052.1~~GHVN01066052.1.p1  ORF type:complete len:844 (-),score=136.29 GHVN01066052.1:1626-4157(-)